MPKISKSLSVTISLVLTVLFLAVLIAAAVILPSFVQLISPAAGRPLGQYGRVLICAAGYVILSLAVLADVLLFRLLEMIRRGLVFSALTVSLIRGVSWCAFGISVVFMALTVYYLIAIVLSFTAVLLGLCLRVVKNVIEQATEIKSENDLTV